MPPNLQAIQTKNQQNLKRAEGGSSVRYLFAMISGKPVLLIGDGHDAAVMTLMEGGQHHEGAITIKKGSITDAGTLRVTGCRNRRAEFEHVIAGFSKKKVVFV